MVAIIEINGEKKKVIIDSGAGRTYMGRQVYDRIRRESDRLQPLEEESRLVAAGGMNLTLIGKVECMITINGKKEWSKNSELWNSWEKRY